MSLQPASTRRDEAVANPFSDGVPERLARSRGLTTVDTSHERPMRLRSSRAGQQMVVP
jgi:hypothetical protein